MSRKHRFAKQMRIEDSWYRANTRDMTSNLSAFEAGAVPNPNHKNEPPPIKPKKEQVDYRYVWKKKITFGQYKGKRVKDIPLDYLRWMCANFKPTFFINLLRELLNAIDNGTINKHPWCVKNDSSALADKISAESMTKHD